MCRGIIFECGSRNTDCGISNAIQNCLILLLIRALQMEIDSEKQYQLYLRRFEEIFQAKQGSTESNEADLLAILIKNYEDKHYDISSTNRLA